MEKCSVYVYCSTLEGDLVSYNNVTLRQVLASTHNLICRLVRANRYYVFYYIADLIHSGEAVTLHSSLKQNTLCPNDRSANFVCSTSGSSVVLRVNNRTIFFNNFQVGRSKNVDNHIAALLRHSNSTGCIAVLNIIEAPDNSHQVRVECSNSTDFAVMESVDYNHIVSGMLGISREPCTIAGGYRGKAIQYFSVEKSV